MNLRYHHLATLYEIQSFYTQWCEENGIPIAFEDLFQNAETCEIFLSEYAILLRSEREYQLRTSLSRDFRDFELIDYIGNSGSKIDAYIEQYTSFFSTLLLAKPDTPITLTYDDDGICMACQRKHEGANVGKHCISTRYSYRDFAYDLTVQSLSRNGYQIRDEGNRTFSTIAGTIRDTAFLKDCHREASCREGSIQADGHYFQLGLLKMVEGGGYPYYLVTQEYIRGERNAF